MTDRDPSIGADGLTGHDRDLIGDVLARYPQVRRVTLFGSRAMGTFGRGSDIDLALEGPDLDARTLTRIATELEDSDLPYKVDLLLRDDQLDPKLEAHIRRHGKPFGWHGKSLEWITSRLEELSVNFDGKRRPVKESDRRPGPYPYYGASGVVDHVDAYLFDGEYLLVAEDGENLRTRQTPIAFLARGKFWVNNHAHIITGNERADTRFLMYALRHVDIDAYLTGAVMPKLTQGNLNRIEVSHPLLPEQRAIASVLGALDEKIEQNRRTAQALERLARAIFRAWFVDFEPVKAKAAGATAFPSMPQSVFDALPTRFVDSAIGPVPEGWEVKAITQVATFLNGLALQKYPPRNDGQDLRVIKIAQLRRGSTEGADWANSDVPEQYVVEDGDLLFSWSGTLETEFWFGGKGALNQHLFKVTSAHFPSWFCFLWIRQHLPDFRAIAAGKATTMGHIQRRHLQEAKVVVPPADVVQAAVAAIGSLYDLHAQVMIESRKLAGMRDYLLPKLLSGAVRVNEPKRFADEVV